MPQTRECPDCGVPLERMELQGSDAVGEITVVSEGDDEGLLGGFRAEEILTPVPFVCPECRRILLYAED